MRSTSVRSRQVRLVPRRICLLGQRIVFVACRTPADAAAVAAAVVVVAVVDDVWGGGCLGKWTGFCDVAVGDERGNATRDVASIGVTCWKADALLPLEGLVSRASGVGRYPCHTEGWTTTLTPHQGARCSCEAWAGALSSPFHAGAGGTHVGMAKVRWSALSVLVAVAFGSANLVVDRDHGVHDPMTVGCSKRAKLLDQGTLLCHVHHSRRCNKHLIQRRRASTAAGSTRSQNVAGIIVESSVVAVGFEFVLVVNVDVVLVAVVDAAASDLAFVPLCAQTRARFGHGWRPTHEPTGLARMACARVGGVLVVVIVVVLMLVLRGSFVEPLHGHFVNTTTAAWVLPMSPCGATLLSGRVPPGQWWPRPGHRLRCYCLCYSHACFCSGTRWSGRWSQRHRGSQWGHSPCSRRWRGSCCGSTGCCRSCS
mmetsp:Transcript_81172/g.178385  ORF Transcript_81172/g.178385 Transcript_81172/m.178385 type:complete len:425 (-) Transcript_81172:277-1551(-)